MGKISENLLEIGGKQWYLKPFRRIPFANERLAHDLSMLLALDGVRVPLAEKARIHGRQYLASPLIPTRSLKYQKNDHGRWPLLPENGVNGLILRLLMSDIDGNWQNILVEQETTWLIDFEYAGHFHNYERRFIRRNPMLTWRIFSGFLGDNPNLDVLMRQTANVHQAVREGRLSEDMLRQKAEQHGLTAEESAYYARYIIGTAESIEDRVRACIDAYHDAVHQLMDTQTGDLPEAVQKPLLKSGGSFYPFEVTDGARCGPSCLRLTLQHFGYDKPSFEKLDDALDRHNSEFTHLVQMAAYLINKGFKLHYFFDTETAQRYLRGEASAIFNERRPESARLVDRFTNHDAVKQAIRTVLDSGQYIEQQPTYQILEDMIYRDCIILCAVDNTVIYDQEDGMLRGHHVLLTGFGRDTVYYQNVGPKNAEPNVRQQKEKFRKAVEKAHFVDYGVLVVIPP